MLHTKYMAWTYKLVQNSLGYFFEIFIVIYVCDLSHNSEEINNHKEKNLVIYVFNSINYFL